MVRSTARPLLIALLLVAAVPVAALAAGQDFALHFVAAAADTYDHQTGAGARYATGAEPHVTTDLRGGDFACDDLVVFLTAVTVADAATGEQGLRITHSFDRDALHAPGLGFGDVVEAALNAGDPGMTSDGDEAATLVTEGGDEELVAVVEVTGLEAGEQVVLRLSVRITCEAGANPSGPLHAELDTAETLEGDVVPMPEAQLVVFQRTQDVEQPPIEGPALRASCEESFAYGFEDDPVHYRLELSITNAGDEDLVDLTVVDAWLGDLSAGFPDSLPVGETVQGTFERILTVDEAEAEPEEGVTITATGARSGEQVTLEPECITGVGVPGGGEEPGPSPTRTVPVGGIDTGGGGMARDRGRWWVLLALSVMALAALGLRVLDRR